MISHLHFARRNQFLCLFSKIRIKVHYPLECPFTYFFKSLFRSIFEAATFLTTVKSEVSSANNLEFEAKFSDKSMIQIKNNSGPRIELWGTAASTLAREEYWLFNLGSVI